MQIEFEATFTGVDKDAVRAALAKAGGTLVKKESLMRPFVEVEAHDEVTVRAASELLGFNYADAKF